MESNLSGHKTYPDSREKLETFSSNLPMIKGLLFGGVIIG